MPISTAPLIAGLLAGGIHVLIGPDHLAAVTPIAIRQRTRAWITGALWGLGHMLGVGTLAALAWYLRDALPLERISSVSEQIVGLVLIAIGIWTLRAFFRRSVHLHKHAHDGNEHVHLHTHIGGSEHEAPSAHDHRHTSFWIGLLHGAAGSAHFVAILPALAFPTRSEAASYLAGYGAGTLCAMILFASLLGSLSRWFLERGPALYRGAVVAAGVGAIVVGCFWLAS